MKVQGSARPSWMMTIPAPPGSVPAWQIAGVARALFPFSGLLVIIAGVVLVAGGLGIVCVMIGLALRRVAVAVSSA
jgi:hypothetical protein